MLSRALIVRLLVGTWMGCLSLTTSAQAGIATKKVEYKVDNETCIGFLAYDDALTGKRPGVLVVHEWWGLNDYAKQRAEQLAKLGYVAFCADIYGDGKVVDHPNDARAMATKVRSDLPGWRKKAVAALDVLKGQAECDPKNLAAIGYCFGGTTCLHLAYSGADLKGVATFHAGLVPASADEAKQVKCQFLICHGADDNFIPAEAIQAFRKSLDDGKLPYKFEAYPGARHSFTVPDVDRHKVDGLKYDKAADEASWEELRAFLKRRFAEKS